MAARLAGTGTFSRVYVRGPVAEKELRSPANIGQKQKEAEGDDWSAEEQVAVLTMVATREVYAYTALRGVPGVLPLLGAHVVKGDRLVLCMPACERTLHDRLWKGGAMPAPEAATTFLGLAATLAGAHARRVYHRDIKPANILLDGSRRPHLVDWGFGRQEWSPATATANSPLVCTSPYRPPEVQRKLLACTPRHAVRYDPAAVDMYGLGCCLTEMLRGLGCVTPRWDKEGDGHDAQLALLKATATELCAANPAMRPTAAQVLSRFGVETADGEETASRPTSQLARAALLPHDLVGSMYVWPELVARYRRKLCPVVGGVPLETACRGLCLFQGDDGGDDPSPSEEAAAAAAVMIAEAMWGGGEGYLSVLNTLDSTIASPAQVYSHVLRQLCRLAEPPA